MGRKGNVRPKGANLDGLADRWENSKVVRKLMLQNGSIFAWPSPQKTGVVSFETIAQNAPCLSLLIDLWCPQTSTAMTILAPQAREQAG